MTFSSSKNIISRIVPSLCKNQSSRLIHSLSSASVSVSVSSSSLFQPSNQNTNTHNSSTTTLTRSTTKQQIRWHGGPHVAKDAPTINIIFINPHPSSSSSSTTKQQDEDEEELTVSAKVGETLLQTAHRHDIDLEGACEGVCACSTCHIIFEDQAIYDTLLDNEETEPSEDEEDMLDMAFGLTETSRLGCQVVVSECMEGMKIRVPGATRNFYVDGHVPQPH